MILTADDGKLSLADYLDRMNGLVTNSTELQRVLFEYLYFLRNLIIHRKKLLRLTYDIFIVGLAVSVSLFMVAMLGFGG